MKRRSALALVLSLTFLGCPKREAGDSTPKTKAAPTPTPQTTEHPEPKVTPLPKTQKELVSRLLKALAAGDSEQASALSPSSNNIDGVIREAKPEPEFELQKLRSSWDALSQPLLMSAGWKRLIKTGKEYGIDWSAVRVETVVASGRPRSPTNGGFLELVLYAAFDFGNQKYQLKLSAVKSAEGWIALLPVANLRKL